MAFCGPNPGGLLLTAPARCARRERIRLSQILSRFTYALSWFCVTGFTEVSMLGLKRKVKSRCKVPPAALLPCCLATFLPSCHFPKSKLPKSPKSQIPNPKHLDFPILQSSHAAFLPFSDFPQSHFKLKREGVDSCLDVGSATGLSPAAHIRVVHNRQHATTAPYCA